MGKRLSVITPFVGCCVFVFVGNCFADPPHKPEMTILWQIGTPDNDTAEFALAPKDYRVYCRPGFFIVGRSDPKKAWPYVQPIPAFGAARFTLDAGGVSVAGDVVARGNALENEQLRIEVDPASGSIASLRSKLLGRELVDQTAEFGVNDYLYTLGRTTGEGYHRIAGETIPPLEYLETALHPWTSFVIMPIFALANAYVPIRVSELGAPVALAVMLGLVLGKPLGIVTFSWLAVKTGLAKLPDEIMIDDFWFQLDAPNVRVLPVNGNPKSLLELTQADLDAIRQPLLEPWGHTLKAPN